MSNLRTTLFGCALTLTLSASPAFAEKSQNRYSLDGASSACTVIDDPYEPFNRKMFAVNSFLDYMFLRPVAKAYNHITNDYTKARVNDFTANIKEPITTVNSGLQGKGHNVLVSFWRFVLNTTFGLAGTHDFATQAGVVTPRQDFGKTLAYYGVAPGPYLVLPVLGSTNARDAMNFAVNSKMNFSNYHMNKYQAGGVSALTMISERGNLMPITDKIAKASADPYITIRNMLYQKRENEVEYPKGMKSKCSPAYYK